MKILQIIDEPWDSGLTDYALALSRGLQTSGHFVTVAVRPGKKPYERALEQKLKTWPYTSWLALRQKVHRETYDIVNAHTGSAHSAGLFATWGSPAKLIRTRGEARPFRRTPFWSILYKRTRKVIACSEAIRNQYLQAGLSPSHVVTISPGVHCLDRPLPVPVHGFRVGMVARLDPVKGHSVLLRAASLLRQKYKDAEFIFVGEEANIKIDELKIWAQNLGILNACSFLGWQPDVNPVMRECHVGVVASLGSETVSRVCLEWMASGRAVVATTAGCLPELVADEMTGFLVPPDNPEKMAQALIRLAGDTSAPRRLGEAAWERARTKFSLEQLLSKTLEVYKEPTSMS